MLQTIVSLIKNRDRVGLMLQPIVSLIKNRDRVGLMLQSIVSLIKNRDRVVLSRLSRIIPRIRVPADKNPHFYVW